MISSGPTRFAMKCKNNCPVIVPVAKTGKATHVYWIYINILYIATTQYPNKRCLQYGKSSTLLMQYFIQILNISFCAVAHIDLVLNLSIQITTETESYQRSQLTPCRL